MELAVDGEDVDLPETVAYKGMMLSGVPNFAIALGYTNASWTLKCDLVAASTSAGCSTTWTRNGYAPCTPRSARPVGADAAVHRPQVRLRAALDRRSSRSRATRAPWRLYQNYARDILMLRRGALEDGAIEFSQGAASVPEQEPLAA